MQYSPQVTSSILPLQPKTTISHDSHHQQELSEESQDEGEEGKPNLQQEIQDITESQDLQEQTLIFHKLPPEVLVEIFSYILRKKDQDSVCLVCRQWRSLLYYTFPSYSVKRITSSSFLNLLSSLSNLSLTSFSCPYNPVNTSMSKNSTPSFNEPSSILSKDSEYIAQLVSLQKLKIRRIYELGDTFLYNLSKLTSLTIIDLTRTTISSKTYTQFSSLCNLHTLQLDANDLRVKKNFNVSSNSNGSFNLNLNHENMKNLQSFNSNHNINDNDNNKNIKKKEKESENQQTNIMTSLTMDQKMKVIESDSKTNMNINTNTNTNNNVETIFSVLPSLSVSLTGLSLASCTFDEKTHFHFVSYLTSLQYLDLSFTCVSDASLVSSVSTLTQLKGLYLQCTNVSDNGLSSLLHLSSLTCLDLSKTKNVGSLSLLRQFPSLCRINFESSHLIFPDLEHFYEQTLSPLSRRIRRLRDLLESNQSRELPFNIIPPPSPPSPPPPPPTSTPSSISGSPIVRSNSNIQTDTNSQRTFSHSVAIPGDRVQQNLPEEMREINPQFIWYLTGRDPESETEEFEEEEEEDEDIEVVSVEREIRSNRSSNRAKGIIKQNKEFSCLGWKHIDLRQSIATDICVQSLCFLCTTSLRSLSLYATFITNTSLLYLPLLPFLTSLDLAYTSIDSQAFPYLSLLSSLSHLSIAGTPLFTSSTSTTPSSSPLSSTFGGTEVIVSSPPSSSSSSSSSSSQSSGSTMPSSSLPTSGPFTLASPRSTPTSYLLNYPLPQTLTVLDLSDILCSSSDFSLFLRLINLRQLFCSKNVNDHRLIEICQSLPLLEVLSLIKCKFSSFGLSHLSLLTRLSCLDLTLCPISINDLISLSSSSPVPQIVCRDLNLKSTRITLQDINSFLSGQSKLFFVSPKSTPPSYPQKSSYKNKLSFSQEIEEKEKEKEDNETKIENEIRDTSLKEKIEREKAKPLFPYIERIYIRPEPSVFTSPFYSNFPIIETSPSSSSSVPTEPSQPDQSTAKNNNFQSNDDHYVQIVTGDSRFKNGFHISFPHFPFS